MNDAPHLLIEWSSPWEEFVAAIGPALGKSPPRLGLETRAGLFPWRGMTLVFLLEIAVLAAMILMPLKGIQPTASQPPPPTPDVIYFSANELPRTEDLAGASGGKAGRSGGASMRHTQTIRVARDEVVRERVVDAPQLNLPKSDSQIRNLLAFRADAGPAPAEALPMNRQAPRMAMTMPVAPPPTDMPAEIRRQAQLSNPAVVPPPVEISQHDLTRRNPLAASVVAPPPVDISQHDLTRRSLLAAATVVPPPASAPAEITSRTARLTLPPETVVAPRPEISSSVQSRHLNNDFNPRVAPPPVDLSAVRTSSSSAALSGRQTVAPPPVDLPAVRSSSSSTALSGRQTVAPPPVQLQNVQPRAVQGLGNAAVAAPPAEVASLHSGRALNASNVSVLPPPDSTATSHNSSGGAGTGKGPVSSSAGVVVSPQPGNKPGLPANSEKATLAMSPSGSSTPGVGGSGNGTSIGHGSNSGSAPAGVGSGSTAVGTGRGASAYDRPGNSPTPGPGGAGNLSSGTSRVPGVSVSGGSNVVTLPSFGPAPDPAGSGHSSAKGVKNGITIVASPRSGGALNLYGALKGDRVYTIYLTTAAGAAVMQFADPDSVAHPYDGELTAPQAIRVNVPSDAPPSRLLIACVLDQNGTLRHWHVLEADSSDFSAKILAALPDWKFTPAFRGSQPVEVNAILGFAVDTK